MTRLPKEELLTGDYLIPAPDEKLVNALFSLLTPENSNVGFVDHDFAGSPGVPNKTLEHYGVVHTIQDFDAWVPHWREWIRWVDPSGKTSQDTVDQELLQRLQEFFPHLRETLKLKHPEPVKDVPKNI